MKEIATFACNEAIKDAGIEKNAIEAFYLGNFISGILLGQETIAPLVANSLGLPKDIPCTKVEGACCSGAIAFRHGYLLIASEGVKKLYFITVTFQTKLKVFRQGFADYEDGILVSLIRRRNEPFLTEFFEALRPFNAIFLAHHQN